MAYKHGLYFSEMPTSLTAPSQVDSGIVVAVGTSPVHLAAEPASLNKPVLAYTYAEAVESLGYSTDFEKYTLCEVMQNQFSLYNVAPVVFINVLDPAKHYNEIEREYEGVNGVTITDDADINSFKVTSGEYIPPNVFTAETDFTVISNQEDAFDDDTGESSTVVTNVLSILNTSKVVNNKIKISYRTLSTALGGSPVETEITLNGTSYDLPSDTVVESVTVKSGGVNTLIELVKDVDWNINYENGVATIEILNTAMLIDNKFSIKYHTIDPNKVTATDIIGGVDAATGKATGIELVESIFPMFNLVAGTLIAPKYSLNSSVTAALVAKAKAVSGIFPAMAIADIDTAECKTYQQAVEKKNASNLSDSHLIVCWPKIQADGVQYFMSTQLAALMNQVDVTSGGGIPYISPSNQNLQMEAAVLEDGQEIFLTRDQANFLNQNGIGTALSFVGWKFWGNRTSICPSSSDPREAFISIRRMFNFINATFVTTYISHLDHPINKRMIESILQSANIYLSGLVTQGCILGGRLEYVDAENASTDLMDGKVSFHLYLTPPSPARSLEFVLEYSTDYLSTLFS